jgi:signal transduction histidine kinase
MFGEESAERSSVDIRLLVSNILALASGELESHQIVLRNEIREGLPEVLAARVQLQQVILNLILNAIEAMSSVTGRERCLTIASSLDQPASLTIAVEDTGIGIDPAHFDRIFDPFFTTKAQMGFGLSICRSIIEAHGGRLLASPRNPFGSSFYLSLPISAASSSGQSSKS